jgi:hypothetical protein
MRSLCCALAVLVAGATLAAAPKFLAVWKSPDLTRLDFKGKTVAALVITDDLTLEMSGEEALVRELTARGVNAIPTYRIVPRPELKNAEKAKGWFEQRGVQGVVVLRPEGKRVEHSSPVMFTSGYYQSFWGYYGYGWENVYVSGPTRENTFVTVEVLIYDVTGNKLAWAGTSETKDPKNLQQFVADLVKEAAKEMKKMKIVG